VGAFPARDPGIMNRIPDAISARFARYAAILLVSALFAGCGRVNLDLDTVCYKWPLAEHRTFVIQSRERRPVTIQKIVLNGEYLIDKIDSDSGPQAFHAVTLKTGESASYVVNYSERVTYADIYSDRGLCRCDLR